MITEVTFARGKLTPKTWMASMKYTVARITANPNSYTGPTPSTIQAGAGVAISASSTPSSCAVRTRTGIVLGTPGYMAPELIRTKPITANAM